MPVPVRVPTTEKGEPATRSGQRRVVRADYFEIMERLRGTDNLGHFLVRASRPGGRPRTWLT
jgi:hypothetical protein